MQLFKLVTFFFLVFSVGFLQAQSRPNIVLIYVDDLGYGDIGVNGAIGVKTPNVDRLARGGVNFRDAHSAAATCTPSRFSLLTGTYAFRNRAAILNGDAPLLIDTDTRTLADVLKDAGYRTGVVGKWHLGLGDGQVNWNERVSPGPAELGFDYSFLIPATGDRIPTVFLENQMVVGLEKDDPITVDYRTPIPGGYPLGTERPELLKQYTDPQHLGAITNGISRIGYMRGGRSALWVDEEFPFVLTEKAIDFIDEDVQSPFFLFFSLHDIHQPRIAHEQFIESSIMGPRGDVIAQMDWCVGAITAHLDSLGLDEQTMIIFTSDNGPILDDGYLDYARELVGNHRPGGPFRGSKYAVYEAGTRMPTVVYWPEGIKKPLVSDALLSQVDLYATLASLVGVDIRPEDGPDSQNHLDAWLGQSETGRAVLLEQAYAYGLRKGKYKYIHPTSTSIIPQWLRDKFVDPGFSSRPQLYDLESDPAETNNLADKFPDIVSDMRQTLEQILEEPESRD
ncbi:MAG: arylsulfatase [Bacteroidota bacterium]